MDRYVVTMMRMSATQDNPPMHVKNAQFGQRMTHCLSQLIGSNRLRPAGQYRKTESREERTRRIFYSLDGDSSPRAFGLQ